uniref:Uncharacterized protein n=1 Tax=Arundo donax TaxID=35708 RepID=A0A0A9B1V5_ARUDO
MPVCACCHAGKSGGFGRFYLQLAFNRIEWSQVCIDYKMPK